jgi:hypothetical protein
MDSSFKLSYVFRSSRPSSGIPFVTTIRPSYHLPVCFSRYPTFLLDTVWNAEVVWGLKQDGYLEWRMEEMRKIIKHLKPGQPINKLILKPLCLGL